MVIMKQPYNYFEIVHGMTLFHVKGALALSIDNFHLHSITNCRYYHLADWNLTRSKDNWASQTKQHKDQWLKKWKWKVENFHEFEKNDFCLSSGMFCWTKKWPKFYFTSTFFATSSSFFFKQRRKLFGSRPDVSLDHVWPPLHLFSVRQMWPENSFCLRLSQAELTCYIRITGGEEQ